MRKTIIFFLLFTTLLNACRNNNAKARLLPFDTMKVVIWDMLSVNEWNNVVASQDTVFRKLRDDRVQYQQVFYWHHITKNKFYDSYKYYEQHPDKMKLLIDSVSSYGRKLVLSRNEKKP